MMNDQQSWQSLDKQILNFTLFKIGNSWIATKRPHVSRPSLSLSLSHLLHTINLHTTVTVRKNSCVRKRKLPFYTNWGTLTRCCPGVPAPRSEHNRSFPPPTRLNWPSNSPASPSWNLGNICIKKRSTSMSFSIHFLHQCILQNQGKLSRQVQKLHCINTSHCSRFAGMIIHSLRGAYETALLIG